MTMWYKVTERDGAETIENPTILVDQIKATNKLLKKDPANEVRIDLSDNSP